jgi:hypothetical protein
MGLDGVIFDEDFMGLLSRDNSLPGTSPISMTGIEGVHPGIATECKRGWGA